MAEATFQVDVVSAERELFSGESTGVYARGVEGDIGLLPGHQPALVLLGHAPVRVKRPDGDQVRIAVHNGFLECRGDELTVLADLAELAVEIDVDRARAARARAVRQLEQAETDEDAERARDALARADLRLGLVGAEASS